MPPFRRGELGAPSKRGGRSRCRYRPIVVSSDLWHVAVAVAVAAVAVARSADGDLVRNTWTAAVVPSLVCVAGRRNENRHVNSKSIRGNLHLEVARDSWCLGFEG